MGALSFQTTDRLFTIDNGASLSGEINIEGFDVVGIQMPAAWTAADLTFQAGYKSGTLNDVYDEGTELTVTAAASRTIVGADVGKLSGFTWLKIRSGTAGVAVNQAAARTIVLILRRQ